MSADSRKTAETKAPSWMDRTQKRLFRRYISQLTATEVTISEPKVDLIVDLVDVRMRIGMLDEMLKHEVERSSSFVVDKARILALSKQIDASTKLDHQITDRLGLST